MTISAKQKALLAYDVLALTTLTAFALIMAFNAANVFGTREKTFDILVSQGVLSKMQVAFDPKDTLKAVQLLLACFAMSLATLRGIATATVNLINTARFAWNKNKESTGTLRIATAEPESTLTEVSSTVTTPLLK